MSTNIITQPTLECNFCGRTAAVNNKFIASDKGIICSTCMKLYSKIIKKDEDIMNYKDIGTDVINTPSIIKKTLDKYVIGQESAKKVLSVAAYNHYKRLSSNGEEGVEDLAKSNVILMGPTGCGKTLLVKTLAKILQVPFATADATSFTEAGYVGQDVESVISRLYLNSEQDVKQAEAGIIYIDEIDKLVGDKNISRGDAREAVQQVLLKIIEGTVSNVPETMSKSGYREKTVDIDTSNILFIVSGAFDKITEIISSEEKTSSIGFNANVEKSDRKVKQTLYSQVEPEHLIKYGIIPELVGRLPVIATLESLTEKDLIKILIEPNDAIVKQFTTLFSLDNVKLTFKPSALKHIAKKAVEKGVGARGLRAIVEGILLDKMFSIPDSSNVREIVVKAVKDGKDSKIEIIEK